MPTSRTVVVRSVASAIIEVRDQLLSELKANKFSQEDVFAVHLALEEAFINAITHGNKMDADKQIQVDYLIDSDRVEISMTDEGDGFDPKAVPDPRCGDNLYKAEGRGLFLIRAYMDVVEFNDRGNAMRMVRYREKPRIAGTGVHHG
ncbi:MAG: ATP-binding protein [Planctomycetota bacterium]